MRILYRVMLVGVAIWSQTGVGQEDFDLEVSPREKVVNVSTNPLALLLRSPNIGVDAALSKQFTVGGSVLGMDDVKIGDLSLSGIGLEVRWSYYPKAWNISGMFVQPFYRYEKGKINEIQFSASQIGGRWGYSWFFDSFNINLAAGLGYAVVSSEGGGSLVKVHRVAGQTVRSEEDDGMSRLRPKSGITPSLAFSIGYAI
jgi:hypothetical protein